MREMAKSLSVLALAAALAQPLAAQESDGSQSDGSDETQAQTPAAPDDLNMGEEVSGSQEESSVGQSYVAGEFGDWEQRCVRTEEGQDPCELFQLLRDSDDNPVSQISIFALPEGQQAAAGATIITPLETLLTRQLTLSVDGGQARRYPFEFCVQQGCVSRIGLTDAELEQFRRGAEATMTIVPVAAPDQEIQLSISLNGFTAGYEEVNAANNP